MRKDEKTYKIPSMRKRMINHQIPMRKDEKTYDKPSDSYEKRWENLWYINHKIPMGKDEKTYDKPSDS